MVLPDAATEGIHAHTHTRACQIRHLHPRVSATASRVLVYRLVRAGLETDFITLKAARRDLPPSLVRRLALALKRFEHSDCNVFVRIRCLSCRVLGMMKHRL